MTSLAAIEFNFNFHTSTNPLICSQVSTSACPVPSTTITQASTTQMLSSSSFPPVMITSGTSPTSILPQTSSTTQPTINTSPQPTSLPASFLPMPSQSLSTSSTSTVVRSASLLSVTSTPTDSQPNSFLDSPINLAAMSVAVLLFLMVIVLIIIIICITMRKRTRVIKIGATPGIDNPDYHQGERHVFACRMHTEHVHTLIILTNMHKLTKQIDKRSYNYLFTRKASINVICLPSFIVHV